MHPFSLALIFLLIFPSVFAQNPELIITSTGTDAGFRSLSVVNDSVIWAGGTKGTVCKSTNGGITFHCVKVSGFDSTDFRSIYAFNERSAVIANVGSPARILRTDDGGTNWVTVYENDHKDAFIDGIDFWNEKEGICYGDPIDGLLLLLHTSDGGQTWRLMYAGSRPLLVDNEASFAASGTGVRCYENGRLMISTGGEISRLLYSSDFGKSWNSMVTPILQGKSSTGIFSFDFFDEKNGVIVGGDYRIDTLKINHVFYTDDGGTSWNFPSAPTRGYRECVTYVSSDTLIATGPTGIDFSTDGGNNWKALSDERGFHVVRKARHGRGIFVAGKQGRIGTVMGFK